MNANSRNFEAELTAIGLEAEESSRNDSLSPRQPVDSIPVKQVK